MSISVSERAVSYSGRGDYSLNKVQIFCLVCEQTKSEVIVEPYRFDRIL